MNRVVVTGVGVISALGNNSGEYAEALHLTPKTLGRIVRDHLGTTLTDLIRSRILIHAKWQLLHTLKPVKEVARELGFGDELYFSRLFKKATGISPHQYVMKARLDRAQQMLVQTDLSLAALSEATGFASQSHFSRAFRAWFGLAPSDYRQQERRGLH